jgi:hypothetical protein
MVTSVKGIRNRGFSSTSSLTCLHRQIDVNDVQAIEQQLGERSGPALRIERMAGASDDTDTPFDIISIRNGMLHPLLEKGEKFGLFRGCQSLDVVNEECAAAGLIEHSSQNPFAATFDPCRWRRARDW